MNFPFLRPRCCPVGIDANGNDLEIDEAGAEKLRLVEVERVQ